MTIYNKLWAYHFRKRYSKVDYLTKLELSGRYANHLGLTSIDVRHLAHPVISTGQLCRNTPLTSNKSIDYSSLTEYLLANVNQSRPILDWNIISFR